MKTLLDYASTVTDLRQEKKVLHKMMDIIMLVFFATLANADDWVEMEVFGKEHEKFLRNYLELPNGIPSHDTIQRVFAMVPSEFLENFQKQWNEMLNSDEGDKIKRLLAIDGKTQRGNGSKNRKANHIVSAVDEKGFCLGQKRVEEKTNEIKAIPELLDSLNPIFISTPAVAFGRCYDILLVMCRLARTNIGRAFDMLTQYTPEVMEQLMEDEEYIDAMADRVSNYLVQISSVITFPYHVEIMNYYFSAITEFERLGDHALNIAGIAGELYEKESTFSQDALAELAVLRQLLDTILIHTNEAFRKQNLTEARRIEPLEQVVDDMVNVLKEHHLDRLRKGECGFFNGSEFFNLLSEAERISDVCSNIGVATVARAIPGIHHQVHDYISVLHSGRDEEFNQIYRQVHDQYFNQLQEKKSDH